MSELYALIIAGGRGTRFWPRSRRDVPKQCIVLGPEGSLLQQTMARLQPLVPPERILVITGPDMERSVREQCQELPPDNVIIEPSGRNTAPCIGLGSLEIGRRGGSDAVMAVLPADHRVADGEGLRRVLAAAAAAARGTNHLVTLGITPTRPETGFGYLEQGLEMGHWEGHAFHVVKRFTEKPDEATAAAWLEGGRHLWNAGMFVFRVAALRDAIRHFLPATAEVLAEVQRRPDRLAELWPETDSISIDYGIMERAQHLLTVPCDVGWSDLGTWESVGESMPEIPGGRGRAERVVSVDARGNVVDAPGKVVALVGVEDLVVVDTGDALLVLRKGHGQQVRQVLDSLEADGLDDLT